MERFRSLGFQEGAHENGIWALAQVHGKSRADVGDIITGGLDGVLKTWRFRDDSYNEGEGNGTGEEDPKLNPLNLIRTTKQHSLPVVNISISRDAKVAASTSLDGALKIWNLTENSNEDNETRTLKQLNATDAWDIVVSADGERVITGGANGMIQVIDGNLGMVDQTYTIESSGSDAKDGGKRQSPMVMAIALSDDDTRIAAGAHDGSVTILDVETGKVVTSLAKHGGPVRSICYLPSEPHTVLTSSDDQLINLYDSESGKVTGTCRGHRGLVFSANGSNDGKYIVSGGQDRSVRIWDRVMRESIYEHEGHTQGVWGVCYAKEGSRVASISDDGRIGALDSSNADTVS